METLPVSYSRRSEIETRTPTYIFLWVFHRLLDLGHEQLQDTTLVSARWECSIMVSVEQLSVNPVLHACIS